MDKFLNWLYKHNKTFSAWVNQKVMEDVTAFKKRSKAQKKAKAKKDLPPVPPQV